MKRTFSFAPEARAELFEAIQYYESESPSLGAAFLSVVNEGIDLLLTYPELHRLSVGVSAVRISAGFPTAFSIRCGSPRFASWQS